MFRTFSFDATMIIIIIMIRHKQKKKQKTNHNANNNPFTITAKATTNFKFLILCSCTLDDGIFYGFSNDDGQLWERKKANQCMKSIERKFIYFNHKLCSSIFVARMAMRMTRKKSCQCIWLIVWNVKLLMNVNNSHRNRK